MPRKYSVQWCWRQGTAWQKLWPPVTISAGKVDTVVNEWRIQGAQATIRLPWLILTAVRTDRMEQEQPRFRLGPSAVTVPYSKGEPMTNFQMPEIIRDQAILLRFAEVIPHTMIQGFRAVVVSEELLAKGEADYRLQHVTQPQRFAGLCHECGQVMFREEVAAWRCANRGCSIVGQIQHVEPKRGIVQVWTFAEFVKETRHGVDYVEAAVAVLDRRYSEETLRGIRKLCGVVADLQGIKLL